MSSKKEKVFQFHGIATVSVVCKVEARTAEEAWKLVNSGDCEWTCEEVDWTARDIELAGEW